MSLDGYIGFVRRVLPSPFTIAILLSVFAYFTILLAFEPDGASELTAPLPLSILEWWRNGLWNASLMVFAMQMMLMLVLGHVLALSPAVDKFVSSAVHWCDSTSKAAAIVTFFSLLLALFNWGLGLIFGAIFARKVGEKASEKGLTFNYALIGAAGYSGLMIWHCGLSGSALIKVAEPGHLRELMGAEAASMPIPEVLSMNETFLSSMNLFVMLAALVLLPMLMFLIGKRVPQTVLQLKPYSLKPPVDTAQLVGAEKMDRSPWLSRSIGSILSLFVLFLVFSEAGSWIDFFTPNNINLLLLALCLLLHSSFAHFIDAVEEAIIGASGILIQFPLYFGIIGMMKESGLVSQLSDFFVSISTDSSYPIFTFISAGVVNVFVPSGGGQWSVQGPVIIESSAILGVDLSKSVLAMAYGDQLTNMLQPFWALPLLGITQLSARDILPYTLVLFFAGALIFASALLLF